MNQYEPNPFEDEKIADEWTRSVEGEKGMIRDKEIYPRVLAWSELFYDGATVIDIGSGQGICSSKISGKLNYMGIEPSIPLTVRAIQAYGENKKRSFKNGNAYNLPIMDNMIDGALSVNVWFHLQNLNQASRELQRVLKSGGKFLIVTANPESYESFWEEQYTSVKRLGNMIVGKVNVPINPLSENTFFLHSGNELERSFIDQGLKIDKITPLGDIGDAKIFISIEGYKE